MSRTKGSVIILEDHEATAKELVSCIRAEDLVPRYFPSSKALYERLQIWGDEPHPLLAIIDLEMSNAPEADRNPTSFDCLRLLAKDFPDVLTIVYSGNLEQDSHRTAVWKAHPRALLHDKHQYQDKTGKGDVRELQTRIKVLLTKEVGPFKIYQGLVLHAPSFDFFTHEVGVRILLAHPGGARVHGQAETKGAQRFRRWVEDHAPGMTVQNQLKHTYCLVEAPEEQ